MEVEALTLLLRKGPGGTLLLLQLSDLEIEDIRDGLPGSRMNSA